MKMNLKMILQKELQKFRGFNYKRRTRYNSWFFCRTSSRSRRVIPPSKDYFTLIQPILKNIKSPNADEVICGFGRTGNLWGCETYNINPDMIISSKCLTAGFFPMGAVIVKKDLADEFTKISEEAEEFPHGFTSGGHPVGCAIALKAIDIIMNEGLLQNVKDVSPYFFSKVKRI